MDPSCRVLSDVRRNVSSARSAENEFSPTSTAVRQTPLTATLSPIFNSVGTSRAITVIRVDPALDFLLVEERDDDRVDLGRATSTTLPVSRISPVNISSLLPARLAHKDRADSLPRQNLRRSDAPGYRGPTPPRSAAGIQRRLQKEPSLCPRGSWARNRERLCPRCRKPAPPSLPTRLLQ